MNNKKTAIKAIIFDLGNVLIGFDHRIAVKKIVKHTDLTVQEIYDLFFDSALTRSFEEGKMGPAAFFKKIKTLLGLRLGYREFLPIWNEIFFAKPETEEFITSLPSDLRLIMLSNINRLHYEYIVSAFPSAINLFGIENVIASFMTGFVKPAREIYELAIKKAGTGRESIVYIDDRKDLIEAASGYGICSIQFKGTSHLNQEFKRLGIKR